MSTLRATIKGALFPWLTRLIAHLPGPAIEKVLAERAQELGAPLFFPEYPFDSRPRWTASHPHPQILQALDAGNERYATQLEAFNALAPQMSRIPAERSAQAGQPCWRNGWLPALDAVSLYGFLATRRPRRYFEIGSGNSTMFVRRAIQDFGLETEVLSIDPAPRAEIESLCDRVLRVGLERVNLSVFDELQAGDMIFVDNSHRALMNSDVTAFFLDVLPRLKKGVLVGVHDIYWPLDYPEDWAPRFYSEQYLLAPLILWKSGFTITLPCFHVSVFPRTEIVRRLDPLWQQLPSNIEKFGGAFWFEWR